MHLEKNNKLSERAVFWIIIMAAIIVAIVIKSLLEFNEFQDRETKATLAAIPTMTAESLEFLYQKGLGYINIKRWQEAKTAMEGVFEIDPNYIDVQAKLIEIDTQIANSHTPTAIPSSTSTPTPSTPTPSDIQISSNDPTDGFVAYYPFNGNANDEGGEGNDGFEFGGIEYVEGVVAEAAFFDGSNDFIDLPDSFFAEITVSAFVRYDRDYVPPNDKGYKYVAIVDGWKDRENFRLGIQEEYGQIMFSAGFHDYFDHISAYEEIHVNSNTVLGSGDMYHAAMTFDGIILKLYVNGILENQITVNKNRTYTGTLTSNAPDIRLGVSRRNTGWFYGVVDEVRLYNEALSPEEIFALYEEAMQ
ncbi:MAG: LamG domain-containing protein [Chloroflexi bacterium]|nr:MAG: LamG domain-containing protein [Chloroflexota bacterium]